MNRGVAQDNRLNLKAGNLLMSTIHLEKQEATPIDEATKAALEEARLEIRRGEGVSLQEARATAKKQSQILRETQREVLAA